ncbi:MAG: hypothetical protein IKQ54_04000 [Oscillospiraceae bacterium]|nr:hypothetical protein [Oscillospiraceae bacterium]
MKRLNKLFAQILVLTLLLCLLSGCGSAEAETGAVTTVPETDTAIQTTAAVPVQTTEEPVTSTESAATEAVTTEPVTEATEAPTEAPTEKPTEPKPTEPKPTEPKPTEPKPTEPKPTEPKPTEPKPTEPAPTQPANPIEQARNCIGKSVNELYKLIGKPNAASYAPSCEDPDAEDGLLEYNGFTVWTLRYADGNEVVYDVFD